jgi:hypothetical protein
LLGLAPVVRCTATGRTVCPCAAPLPSAYSSRDRGTLDGPPVSSGVAARAWIGTADKSNRLSRERESIARFASSSRPLVHVPLAATVGTVEPWVQPRTGTNDVVPTAGRTRRTNHHQQQPRQDEGRNSEQDQQRAHHHGLPKTAQAKQSTAAAPTAVLVVAARRSQEQQFLRAAAIAGLCCECWRLEVAAATSAARIRAPIRNHSTVRFQRNHGHSHREDRA